MQLSQVRQRSAECVGNAGNMDLDLLLPAGLTLDTEPAADAGPVRPTDSRRTGSAQ